MTAAGVGLVAICIPFLLAGAWRGAADMRARCWAALGAYALMGRR